MGRNQRMSDYNLWRLTPRASDLDIGGPVRRSWRDVLDHCRVSTGERPREVPQDHDNHFVQSVLSTVLLPERRTQENHRNEALRELARRKRKGPVFTNSSF